MPARYHKKRGKKWRARIGEGVSKLTEERVGKLKEAFAIGANVRQACFYAEIHPDTYYEWLKNNQVLSDEIAAIQEKLPLQAKRNIALRIHGKTHDAEGRALVIGSIPDSWRFLEKREPEVYGEKLKLEHSGEVFKDGGQEPSAEEVVAYQDYIKRRREIRQRRALESVNKELEGAKKE